jgi:hypothetical protein
VYEERFRRERRLDSSVVNRVEAPLIDATPFTGGGADLRHGERNLDSGVIGPQPTGGLWMEICKRGNR